MSLASIERQRHETLHRIRPAPLPRAVVRGTAGSRRRRHSRYVAEYGELRSPFGFPFSLASENDCIPVRASLDYSRTVPRPTCWGRPEKSWIDCECHLKGRVLVSIEIKFPKFSRISFPI